MSTIEAPADTIAPARDPNYTPSLNRALAAVQAAYVRIAKEQTGNIPGKDGKQGYKYNYADLADVSEAILPLLGKNGLAFTSKPTLVNGQFVLAYSLRHESGEHDDGTYPLIGTGTHQQAGSAITYARRYSLCSVTGIAPAEPDDDGAAANERQQFDRPRSAGEAFDNAIPASQYRHRQQPAPLQPLGDEDSWKAKIEDLALPEEASAAWQETVDLVAAGQMSRERAGFLQQHIRAHMARRASNASQNGGTGSGQQPQASDPVLTGQEDPWATEAPEQSAPPARIRPEDQGARRPEPQATTGDDRDWVAQFALKVTQAADGDSLAGLQREIGKAIAAKHITADKAGELSALIRERRNALQTGAAA